MDFRKYKELVSSISVGKQLPDAVYLHESAAQHIADLLLEFLAKASAEHDVPPDDWNVIKLYKRDFKIALLFYPDFFSDSYPALHRSYTIDLTKNGCRIANYSDSGNPPILHRKETFLHPEHPDVPRFREITKEGEKAGLYENPRTIGFKKSWERLISRKGYVLDDDGRLKPKCNGQPTSIPLGSGVNVERHLTAIDRNRLSAPMQVLARHNYLDGSYSVFDYGCGKGDDARELEAHGLDVHAWDPVYRPDTGKREADIVNLGYVVNVIEDRSERDNVLREAYRYSQKVLTVSAMIAGEATISQFKPYKDGVITSRSTFQKYYSQSELRSYIESVLNESAIAAGPGIFLIFTDKDEEQLFLSERQRVRRSWTQLTRREPAAATPMISRDLINRNQEVFDDFWRTCLDLGRAPANPEFEFSERIRSIAGSHAKAFQTLKEYYGEEIFNEAQQARKEDLLVYFALGLFDKRKAYRHMPDGLKRDLKAFFGTYPKAIEEAKTLLFSVGHPDNIGEACENAYQRLGCGELAEGHSFTLHRSHLNELPGILRVYVGCATQLYGDIDDVDLIKIHMRSGKVSLMKYDDFSSKPIPELTERVKIRLRDQDIDFFDYSGDYEPQPLYLKSRYIDESFTHYNEQLKFDDKLASTGLFDLSGFGPSRHELMTRLQRSGLQIDGFNLRRVHEKSTVRR